jgi:hypothetical protein
MVALQQLRTPLMMGHQRPETCRVRGNIRNKDIKLVASVGTFICKI